MRRTLNAVYTQHENPTELHYKAAEELRPSSELEEDELNVWDSIMPYLALYGRLKPYFIHTLIEYCRVVAGLQKLDALLRKEGDTYESSTRNGYQIKMRPEVGQRNELRRMLRSYVNDFGLSPVAEKQLNQVQLDLFGSDELTNPFIALERETANLRTAH